MVYAGDQLRTPDNNAERGCHCASFILVLYMFWLSFKVYDRTMAGRSRGVLRKKKKKKKISSLLGSERGKARDADIKVS